MDPLWSRISAHEISSEVMIPLRELYQGIKAMKNNIITSSPNNLKNLSGKNCGINCGINCGNNDTLMEEGHSLLGEIETHEQNQEGSTKSVLPLLPNLEAITKIIEIHRGQRELPISASVSKKDKDGKLEGERAEAISSSKGVRTSTKERTASHSTCSEMASLNIVHGQQTTSVHGQQTSSVHGQQTSAVHGQQPPLSIASISNNTSLQHTPTTVQYSPITGNGDRGLEMISGLESGSEVDTREGQCQSQCQSQGHSQGLGQCQGQGLGQGLCQGVRHSTKHSLQHTQTELLQLLSDMEIQCGAAASRLSDFVLLEALDSGRIFLNVERVHPILFLYEITKKYEMISAQKRINMITDFGSRFDDSYIFIDSYELREAFEDLLSNTIRNTPIGGSIQVIFICFI